MSKTSLALTSLVAAIPGSVLAYLLVMAFLGNSERMSGAMLGVAGLTLLLAVAAAVMPVGIFAFGGKSPKAVARKQDADDVGGTTMLDNRNQIEAEDVDDEFGEADEVAESDADVFEVSDEDDFADLDEDEPAPPKKKKRG